MKKWETINKSKIKNQKSKIDEVIKILLDNRGLKTKKDIEEFLNPKLEDVAIKSVGIDKRQLGKAIDRIQKAIKNKEQVIVFGDYDVDGICGTAILWETLNNLGAKATPYIPHRIEEGYGLSTKGISNVKSQISNVKLIITVDNGIVASEAVEFANKQGMDVIITDHHVPSRKLPKAYAIVHTTKLCGAGVAYMLSHEIKNQKSKIKNKGDEDNHLELVALATVADLVPLIGVNRTLLVHGLKQLRKTKRAGLLELCKEAVINPQDIDVYKIGHMIAPRLNAMGRLEYAMDSLRLLCTTNKKRAEDLARLLGTTNRERQQLTMETVEHAVSEVRGQKSEVRKLLFISSESYQQGVIGLVAGRLVEEFYRPAIVVSKGKKYSKASARSVHGFNIIEFIRSASEFLVDAGGHPMAAGFTVETEKLSILQKTLESLAEKTLDKEKLTRTLRIDCEIPLSIISHNLYDEIAKLAPFGMKNPEPTFVSKNVIIEDMRVVGREGKHIKLLLSCHPERSEGSQLDSSPSTSARGQNDNIVFDGIGFGMGERAQEFHIGDKVDIVYTIDENEWNGDKKLQLKVKDLRVL